jgi:hypothetical protein
VGNPHSLEFSPTRFSRRGGWVAYGEQGPPRMSQFNERFEGLEQSRQGERYMRLVDATLQHYGLEVVTPVFIQHNGGVTFRLNGEDAQDRAARR